MEFSALCIAPQAIILLMRFPSATVLRKYIHIYRKLIHSVS